ncbi:MAG TPA: ethanolamine ammonia-lyase subunit EutC [Thermomicrobiales bacterium]|nr:ethanolamine ammonia-lyase subunit EutC [Thermomicrobiales bacterium]
MPECDDRDTLAAPAVVENPWSVLRRFTTARIGLGRAGVSQPTRHHLAFQLAYAQARDAVHGELDVVALGRGLAERGLEAIAVRSAARDRREYLLRPDLGRALDDQSARLIRERLPELPDRHDIAIVIADGLSANAVQRHALPLLDIVTPALVARGWSVAPVTVVSQGRVAIADAIGELFNSQQSVILIGERPGLSAPDSMGLYLTYGPRPGRTDAERNCISNVRGAGLNYANAAETLLKLMAEARRRGLSGVGLKLDDGAGRTDRLGSPDGGASRDRN